MYALVSLMLIVMVSCSKTTSPEKGKDNNEVNNPATRYVDNLREDVHKAQAAVDKANQKIKEAEKDYNSNSNQ